MCRKMSRPFLFPVLLLLFACQLPAFAATEGMPPQMRLKRHVIVDQSANNMPAMTVYVPEDWQFQGAVLWDLQSFIHPARITFQARGPKDGAEILYIPIMAFGFSTPSTYQEGQKNGGTVVRRPMKSEALLREILPHLRKQAANLQVKSVERPKDVEAYIQAEIDKGRAQLQTQRLPSQEAPSLEFDLAVMTVTYTENGRPFEERLLSIITYLKSATAMRMLDARARPYMQRYESTTWTCLPIVSVRAHAGTLQAHDFEFKVVGDNIVQNPTWTASIDAVGQKLIMDNFNQAVISHQKIRESINSTHDYVMKRQREAQASRQASQDRILQRRVDDIRGVERYNTRESSGVALPSGYNHVWEARDGTVILQNDSFFNPNLGSTKDWQKIERAR